MPSLTAPPVGTEPRPRAPRGRWIWTLSGVVTVVFLAVFGSWIFVSAGDGPGAQQPLSAIPTRIVTVSQPVTSVSVTSYGAPIRLARGPVSQVTVVEGITFDNKGAPPVVMARVSDGTLTLAAPSCVTIGCSVRFLVTVPTSVAVNASSDGGEISVSGATTANLDSGGGPVTASGIAGALTVTSEGGSIIADGAGSADLDSGGGPAIVRAVDGPLTAYTEGGVLQVDRLTGPLSADTAGGPVNADGIDSATFRLITDGGGARVGFARQPQTVQVSTGGGPAVVTLPGGPYAVTAESSGGPEQVTVPTGPSATSTVSVITDGGELRVTPPGAGS